MSQLKGLDAGRTSAALFCLSLLAAGPGSASPLEPTDEGAPQEGSDQDARIIITRGDSRPASPGPAEYFTGVARVETLFGPTDASAASGASVSFEPGARSAWHTHPRGQFLIVTAGVGRVQQWGGTVEEIRQGDVVWTPPGVKHWHGASPDMAMTHIALQEHRDGRGVDWLEKVSEEQYQQHQGR